MGCPVKKVTRNGAGSSLLCEPVRAAAIVRAIHEATGLPVTCKIRSGWDEKSRNYLQLAGQLFEAGCAALALHPRTREQGYSGQADWSVIADLKRHFPDRPIIGNGDVKTPADAHRMLETTGCDFVMIGRGALGNPWLFRELLGGAPAEPEERREGVLRHFAAHLEFVGEGLELAGARSFRKHRAGYGHGLRGAALFRSEVNQLDSPAEVEEAVRRFFGSARVDPEAPGEEQDVDYRAALG
jgi:nifR3 family TIM-barrel protein